MMLYNSVIYLSALFIINFGHVSGNEYYIVPYQGYPCQQVPCMTLQTYISSNYENSSTKLFISEGNHSLSTGFSVSNAVEFSMLSADDTQTSPVIICSQMSHFNLSNVTHANIEGLTFIGCGGNTAVLVEQFTIQSSSFVGDKNAATSLVIIDSNVSLSESTFTSYRIGSYRNDRSLNLPLYHQHISDITVMVAVGGALIITNTTLSINECRFETNMANIGGAIFSEMGSYITIINSNFSSNHANLGQSELCYGGALFTDGTGRVIILDSTFENNTSDRDGGMAAVFGSKMSISNTFICHNTATMCGGALTVDVRSTLNLEETTFSHNVADESGGALCVKGNSSVCVSNSSVFISNSALVHYGGSMYLHGSSATLDSSIFEDNKASSGGVAYAKSSASVIMKNNCNIMNNSAKHHGGVIFLTEFSKSIITACTFWNNTAEHGGVMYARDPGNVITISESNFSFNTAGLNGGVLMVAE